MAWVASAQTREACARTAWRIANMAHLVPLFAATLLPLPWFVVRFTGLPAAPAVVAILTGVAILGAAFLLSWAAELLQIDVSQAFALAVLALIAVLPEYAVDAVFAYHAGRG